MGQYRGFPQKRADLLPNLEKVVRTYLSHEKGVLDSLAELRGAVVGVQSYTPAQADQAMRREFALSSRLIALREAYPDLSKSDDGRLHESIDSHGERNLHDAGGLQ